MSGNDRFEATPSGLVVNRYRKTRSGVLAPCDEVDRTEAPVEVVAHYRVETTNPEVAERMREVMSWED